MVWALWLAAALDPLRGHKPRWSESVEITALGLNADAAASGLGVSPAELAERSAAVKPLMQRLERDHPEVIEHLTDLVNGFKKSKGPHTMAALLGSVHDSLKAGKLTQLVHALKKGSPKSLAQVEADTAVTAARIRAFQKVMDDHSCVSNDDCAQVPGNLMGAQCIDDPSRQGQKSCGCLAEEDCAARVHKDEFKRACSDYLGMGFTTCGPAVENPYQDPPPAPAGDAPVQPPPPRDETRDRPVAQETQAPDAEHITPSEPAGHDTTTETTTEPQLREHHGHAHAAHSRAHVKHVHHHHRAEDLGHHH